jgi:serine/threonine-protein kinase
MLHRDIKPSNILLSDRGKGKIGDFGLVTDDLILGYASDQGYRDHLAFEVWNGVGTSERSDIWALGMTMYRLLHGKEWYSRTVAPRYVIAEGGFANSLAWLPHIPDQWRRVIRKMMNDDPRCRYQSADQILAALATLEAGLDWVCGVSARETRWEIQGKERRKIVVWKTQSPRRHEWSAWSEPINEGRRRALGGSSAVSGFSQVERELRQFFR